MVVCKFGGSSVADALHIKKLESILNSDKKREIIVVSAPGKRCKDDVKVTDLLYKCNELAQKGLTCKETFKQVTKRFFEIADDLKIDKSELSEKLDEIRRLIDAGYGSDYSASRGEYLSAFLIAKYLKWEFIDSKDVIVINNDGTVNEQSYDNLKARIQSGKRYVLPGFYGITETGNVKTFSRGGSDITGAIVSRAVGAELYENWTDVSGVFRANPTLIQDAEVIPMLSYNEVRELSEVGASVFHEEAIAPVVKAEIPINIKNTNAPEDKGTMIVKESSGSGVSGVSAKGGMSKITLRKLMLFKKSGMRHALLTMLHIYGIRPCYSLFGIDSIIWYFDSNMASDSVCESMVERIKSEFNLDSISVERGCAMMGLVGPDMDKNTDFIKVLAAMKEQEIEIKSVNYGASDTACLIGINEDQKDQAVVAAYDALYR